LASHEADQIPSNWQLQAAKARIQRVGEARAREEGPQRVSARGQPAVVVVSQEEFARFTSLRRSMVDHILEGPPWPDDVVDAINARPRAMQLEM
jgi:prevent-host-death family protein